MKMSTNILLLVDDPKLLERLLASLYEFNPERTVITAKLLDEALGILRSNKTKLFITDASLLNGDGPLLLHATKIGEANLKVINILNKDNLQNVQGLTQAGVHACVYKRDIETELSMAIQTVTTGKSYFSKFIQYNMMHGLEQKDDQLLTLLEREVLGLMFRQWTNTQIAERLEMKEQTVESLKKNIFRKTKTNSISGLIKFAFTNHL